MKRIRATIIGFVFLAAVLAAIATLVPRATSGQGGSQNAPPHRTLRKYYVTQTLHSGSEALTACATGYHMASVWEIFDMSNLKYETQLGLTRPDSGFGPPTLGIGWIRTGGEPGASEVGTANCVAWTDNTHDRTGTRLFLPRVWVVSNPQLGDVTAISPWVADESPCDQQAHVWCVQD